MNDFDSLELKTKKLDISTIIYWCVGLFTAFLVALALSVSWLTSAPSNFSLGSTVVISPGASVTEIVELLDSENVIRSQTVMYAVLALQHDTTAIQAGTYVFETAQSVFSVADQLVVGGPQIEFSRLTIPEGVTVSEIGRLASAVLPEFDEAAFLTLAKNSEGYLFPDTYFVPDDYTHEDLFTLLRDTFNEKLANKAYKIKLHPLSLEEVITLASIIERESNSVESMRTVSGILQNRLAIDMPLQADASIEYVLDKPLSELTANDLEQDTPYNTYLNRGLPPTPIGNPGMTSIEAVLDPIESDYFYYITDPLGNFHYAKTLNEHNQNVARYLR